MSWSISSHKTFKRCPRQWYYKNTLADGRVKRVPERIEATRLSKLKTIDAWRGDIVDQVISEYLIKKIRFKENISLKDTISIAKNIFDKQFEMESRPRIDGQNYQFGFIDVEFGRTIHKEKLEQAWFEIELALNNFTNNSDLQKELYEAELLFPQRPITFTYEGTSIKAIPDLIAFFRNKSPKIFDWKVNYMGTTPNEEQLIIYGIALKHCNPHKDFPQSLEKYKLNEIRLAEVQLIANEIGFMRNYSATDKKVEAISELIEYSRLQMYGINQDKKYDEISAEEFATTADPDNCFNCGFQKLCKQFEV
jgi:PD-(D/E)XK nuclease superfamily